MADEILEPLKEFPYLLEKVGNEADALFDQYAGLANTDTAANEESVKEYEKAKREMENQKSYRSSLSAKKGGFIFLIVLSFVIAALFIVLTVFRVLGDLFYLWIIFALVLIAGSIALIFYLVKSLNPRIKKADLAVKTMQDHVNALLRECYGQMATLNALLDWGMPQKAIHNAVPLLELDDNFDVQKYIYLRDKYGLEEPEEENISTYHVQSGSILGNPFIWERDFVMRMFNKTYTGSITITWTTTHRGKNGTYTQTHSQTLTATVTRPAPSYSFSTYLLYANEAAPKLTFSRKPTISKNADEKKLEKEVRKREKDAEKIVKKSMMDDDPHDLLLMGNTEFDVLFNALDRNNEQEFRLMFTPLAQKNELALLKSKQPYGDDFRFYKDKKINTIMSDHSQFIDFHANPAAFEGYSFLAMKKAFRDYTTTFFQGLYFDLAPLLSIPIYQMTSPAEYIYGKDAPDLPTTSFYEHEAVANSINKALLKPNKCSTDIIVKTEFLRRVDDLDEVEVTSHGFEAIPKTAYISKMGGDGRSHSIPVHYYEYEPVEKKSIMTIGNANSTRDAFSAFHSNPAFMDLMGRLGLDGGVFERKLFAFLNRDGAKGADLSALSSSLNSLSKK